MKLLFALVLSISAFADNNSAIHGQIIDPSGLPVEGAAIQCSNRTVYSNAEGYFTIPDVATCAARIMKAGFTDASPQLDAANRNRITLQVEGPTENVVVSATRYESTPEHAAVAATVFTATQIEARDFPQLPDLLRETPGVQIAASGGRGSLTSIFTRGSASTDTLVMLDGAPLNDPGGQINLAHFSTEELDRIEIVRGPESVMFGAEAAAGIIQMFTRRGDPENTIPHGWLSYERGNFQTDRWTAGLDGGFANRIDYFLGANQLHTAGAYPDDYYRTTTGVANLGFKFSSRTQLRAIFRENDAHVGTPGEIDYGVLDLPANEETRDSTLSLSADDTRGSSYLQHFSFTYHRLRDLYNDNEPYSTVPLAALLREVPGNTPHIYFVSLLNPNGPFPTQLPPGYQVVQSAYYFGPYSSLNITERKAAGYQGTWAHSGGSIVFGYDYENQSGLISSGNVSRDNNGAYLNAQQNFGNRLFVTAGVRYEHSSTFGSIGTARGGASFQLFGEHGVLSSTTFRISAGRGVVEPSLYENFIQAPFAHGNPSLKPQVTESYEAGIVQDWLSRRIRTEVSVFRNSFQDLIAFVGSSWVNIEQSWARGIETSVEARLLPSVLLTGAYTRLYTRITNSVTPNSPTTGIGDELVRRPHNSGSVTLSITPHRWSFVAGGIFVGERQDADFIFGVNRNPGYENVFLSASYNLTRHITPVIRLDNLLNERYEEVLGYPALSRNVLGGLRLSW